MLPWVLIRTCCKQGIGNYRPALPNSQLPCCIRSDMFFMDFNDLKRLGFSRQAWIILTGSDKPFIEACSDPAVDRDPNMTNLLASRAQWQQMHPAGMMGFPGMMMGPGGMYPGMPGMPPGLMPGMMTPPQQGSLPPSGVNTPQRAGAPEAEAPEGERKRDADTGVAAVAAVAVAVRHTAAPAATSTPDWSRPAGRRVSLAVVASTTAVVAVLLGRVAAAAVVTAARPSRTLSLFQMIRWRYRRCHRQWYRSRFLPPLRPPPRRKGRKERDVTAAPDRGRRVPPLLPVGSDDTALERRVLGKENRGVIVAPSLVTRPLAGRAVIGVAPGKKRRRIKN
ncbi:hypothetical protein AGDE_15226 [Angomonas deanei]|uniref:Uncharacterized protein n=1 Tax=Angomonas deanei TaxID=59799 RepID=A0A7G2CT58_9TRYP|nr:hypothetical protein AGDE_15226 [Angomonas deanei]CAD2222459.1 hypothetical protein, conserved [Angomonas deanei]|eukprot:EPY19455.1 hypothetical protein AGDE_15226 [Angomonas deanei]